MGKYIDISMPVYNGMISWPSDPPVEIRTAKSQEMGNRSLVSEIHFGSHTGTHIDAPKHYLEDGVGVDEIALDRLIGPCQVVDCRGRRSVSLDLVRKNLRNEIPRVLFRTDNSFTQREKFYEDFVAIEPDLAAMLVEWGYVLAGVDGLSIDSYHAERPAAHLQLLEAGMVIIEGLDLREANEGIYELICLPLRIKKGDGAPARAVLRRLD